MFEKILVPLDGSKAAEQVFPYVIELASAFGSEVISVGVCEPEESEYGHICQIYVNNQTDILKSKIGTDKVKSVTLTGKPAEEIIDYAGKSDINLIVMASHGRSGIKPWSLGSTVDKVLHKVNVPLLIIRATEKPVKQNTLSLFQRILAPMDGTEICETVLPYLVELIKKVKSEITLLQVLASGKHVHTIGGIDFVYFKDHDISSTKTRAQEYFNRTIGTLEGPLTAKKYEIKFGDPAEEIVKCAKEINSQVIALSTHGHTSIERWAYGSVTYKVLQTSKQSILLIPQANSSS
jgi:nucleotide-binding universal stress UspA family protein